ncbi:MAG: hypothetical protein B7Y65_04395 [Azorhizobium sp. 35-67-15]|nr:MAG: hypothetical protein B7Y65_04395 [Azorhizobium sp. 35-67-15]
MRFFLIAIAAVLMTAPAAAQVQRVQPYQTFPYPGVPGQNTSPPAPRQQMIAPPPTPPRPSTGDAANRIQGTTRKPLPNVNGE